MKLKKAFLLFVVALVAFSPVRAFATTEEKTIDDYVPTDIEGHWAEVEIDDFISANIISGYKDEEGFINVKPGNNITRAQFVKILVNAMSLEGRDTPKEFPDVTPTDWYYDYVNIASSLDIVNGSDGQFNPNANITRDQITAMIVRAFEATVAFPEGTTQSFDDVDAEYWAFNEVNKASEMDIIKGYGDEFKPRNLATRAQAVVMIHRALQKEQVDLDHDQEIVDFFTSYMDTKNELLFAKSYDELVALETANAFGYYQVVELQGIEEFKFLEEEGVEISVVADRSNENINVLSTSKRFARVQVTNSEITISFDDGTTRFETTVNVDGEYSLNKVGNEWRIYNYYPYFDEEEGQY